jgi:ABC-type transporter Mla subunit MlaD
MTAMRLSLFPVLGLIEVAAALALLVLGFSLPGPQDVRRSFDGARRVTSASGDQLRLLREQVADLRGSRLRPVADHLQAATRTLTATLRKSRVDFDTVRSIRDAAGRSADGLDGLARALDAEALGKLGDGLGATADFLDQDVVPAATKSADDLDAASERLRAGARRFGNVLAEAPLDLKPLREVHDGLARFDEGLDSLHATLDPRRLAALRQATEGAEGVVAEAARLAERAAGYTYPVVTLDGLKPAVRNRAFWPRGAEVSADMRQVAGGVAAMGREIEALARELPKVQAAVAESRKSVGATRKALAGALARQEEVERLLAEMPAQAARLVEELPRMTGDLSLALRGTEPLVEVAVALRKARRGLDVAVANWPVVRSGLSASAGLLRGTRDQLDGVIRHRADYEAARGQVEELSEEFAALLPAFTDGLYARLDREDRALDEMARGIAQVDEVLPTYARALLRCLVIGRLLAWVVAVIAGLHGLSLILCRLPPARPAARGRPEQPDDDPGSFTSP